MDKLLQLKRAVRDAVAPDPLAPYKLSETTRQVGHQRLLKAVDATDRSSGEPVTVFIWSNQHVQERCGGSNNEEYRFILQKMRDGVQALTRMRHPNILRVLMPLTEDKARHRFVYVTEKVDHWVGGGQDDASSRSSKPVAEKRVETSYGMLQIGQALEFLHNKGSVLLLHLSPSSIVVTQSGDWKIADMTHCVVFTKMDDGLHSLTPLPPSASSLFQSVAAPLVDFCAPEVVTGFEKLAATASSAAGGSSAKQPSTVPDLFDFNSNNSSQPAQRDGPVFPDSDIFSFIATTVALVEGQRLINCGGEASVYHRQKQEASNTCKRLFPQWVGGANSLLDLPRVPLTHLLQTECFAAREVRLLAELPNLLSMEPRAKLTLLKGFHDEIAKGSFGPTLLQRWVVPPLMQQTEDERMIKYIVPILLEAAFQMPTAVFDASLRSFLSAMMGRAIGAFTSLSRGGSSTAVDTAAAATNVGASLLAQLLDKFPRFWEHYASPKDIQGLIGPLICCGLTQPVKDVVREALKSLEVLLKRVDRAFPCGDGIARDVLSGVIKCPEEAPRALQCLLRLLPTTTREGREAELEPKLVAGLQELCKSATVAATEVEQLLKVLMSIVAESTVDHVATVTLPLLCPLLVIRHKLVREHISTYVNQLVQLVITKRNSEEQEEDRQRQIASSTFEKAPSAVEMSRHSSRSNAPSTPPTETGEASTSFFMQSRGSEVHKDPASIRQQHGGSDMSPPPPPSPPPHHSGQRRDDLHDVFGF